ncbi:MAG: hypothetical protein EF812_06645, partial [Methanosarcinales archaeon]
PWSFGKTVIYKNTSKLRANTFGFYPINGRSVIVFVSVQKKEDIRCFLKRIRKANPKGRVITIPDNFSSHKAKIVQECAEKPDIVLVHPLTYSPDLESNKNVHKKPGCIEACNIKDVL